MDSGIYFEPVERAIHQDFLPALMGMPKEDISGRFRELLSQSVKKEGLGIRNPVDSAAPAPPVSQPAPEFDSEEEVVPPGADGKQSRSRYQPNTWFGAGL